MHANLKVNVNANTALAVALGANYLLLLSDILGVYADRFDSTSLLRHVSPTDLQRVIAGGDVSDGMVAKPQTIERILEGGIGRVNVLDGWAEHAVLAVLTRPSSVGTTLPPDEPITADLEPAEGEI